MLLVRLRLMRGTMESIEMSLCREGRARGGMAATLVAFHVTPYAEGLSTARLRALVGFLPSVAMAVDAKAARSRKGLVTGRADVSILRLGKRRLAGGADIMVMLPWVGARCARAWDRHRERHALWLEMRRQRSLRVHAQATVRVLFRRVERSRRRPARRGNVRRLSICWGAIRGHGMGLHGVALDWRH